MPIFKDLRRYHDLKLPMPAVLVLLTRDASCRRRHFASWRRILDSIAMPICKDLRLYRDLKLLMPAVLVLLTRGASWLVLRNGGWS